MTTSCTAPRAAAAALAPGRTAPEDGPERGRPVVRRRSTASTGWSLNLAAAAPAAARGRRPAVGRRAVAALPRLPRARASTTCRSSSPASVRTRRAGDRAGRCCGASRPTRRPSSCAPSPLSADARPRRWCARGSGPTPTSRSRRPATRRPAATRCSCASCSTALRERRRHAGRAHAARGAEGSARAPSRAPCSCAWRACRPRTSAARPRASRCWASRAPRRRPPRCAELDEARRGRRRRARGARGDPAPGPAARLRPPARARRRLRGAAARRARAPTHRAVLREAAAPTRSRVADAPARRAPRAATPGSSSGCATRPDRRAAAARRRAASPTCGARSTEPPPAEAARPGLLIELGLAEVLHRRAGRRRAPATRR